MSYQTAQRRVEARAKSRKAAQRSQIDHDDALVAVAAWCAALIIATIWAVQIVTAL